MLRSTLKVYTYFLQCEQIHLSHLNTKVWIYNVTKHLLGNDVSKYIQGFDNLTSWDTGTQDYAV